MAEGVFRHLTNHTRSNPHPLISHIDSCGTAAYHSGEPPDPRTMSVLAAHGIPPSFYSHAARKFRGREDFLEFDYIFAMDGSNKANLEREREKVVKSGKVGEAEAGRVMLFGEWSGRGKGRGEEVEDPYYGGGKGFEIAYEQVDRFSRNFMEFLEGGGVEGKGMKGK